MDKAGNFKKVIKRQASQPENPLLQEGDEDDTILGTILGPNGRDT